ncbi:hypothetical protein EB796_000326 [Bugula neritina]|uniref:Uncharacterized protein n=1 Tax=Bugula neritina TaxID=10212 RepID=A0A7J7KT60_BUGNE|nr:hypothetical protein EB796_000326 [Bugula neritina]
MNKQEEMARFLIDNGIDTTFRSCRIELREDEDEEIKDEKLQKKHKVTINLPSNIPDNSPDNLPENLPSNNKLTTKSHEIEGSDDAIVTATADVFVVNCRQLAYEKEMLDIVNLIDYKQGCLLRTLKPPNHPVRLIKSARVANNAADTALPPDRAERSSANIHRRKYKKAREKHNLIIPSSAGRHLGREIRQEETITNLSQVPLLDAAYQQDVVAKRKASAAILAAKNRHVFSSFNDYDSHSKPRQSSAMIRLTKAALMRQRAASAAPTADEQQLTLRHPESVETSPRVTTPGLRADYDRRVKSRSFVDAPARPVSYKPSPTSYGNHLPFRRKPPLPAYSKFVGNVLKRSLHCYQHSTAHALH